MSKFSEQAYLDSVKVVLPNIAWINSLEDNFKINPSDIIRLASEEYFLRDTKSLTYQERVAFYVLKSFAADLRLFGYHSYGELSCEDVKSEHLY